MKEQVFVFKDIEETRTVERKCRVLENEPLLIGTDDFVLGGISRNDLGIELIRDLGQRLHVLQDNIVNLRCRLARSFNAGAEYDLSVNYGHGTFQVFCLYFSLGLYFLLNIIFIKFPSVVLCPQCQGHQGKHDKE